MKKIIITLIILFALSSSVFSYNTPGIEKAWDKIVIKIENKYTLEEEVNLLEKMQTQLNLFSKKSDLTLRLKLIVADLKILVKNELDLVKIKLPKTNNNNNNNNIIIDNSSFEEKLNKNKKILDNFSITKEFKNISYNDDHLFLENGIWYSYITNQHFFFPKGTNLTVANLEFNGIDLNKDVIFLKDDGNIGFLRKFQKVKLINDNIISNIANKYNFLKEVKDDKEFLFSDTDNLFISLKQKTEQLTKGKTDSEKIKILYAWILDNVSYTQNLDINDKKIFSGILTYANKDGVCEGYTKLFNYMLHFAGVKNSEVIRGFVFDAADFPKIGHAWVKIGNKYYDPTFDDPVGLTKSKKYGEYNYFGLNKDLFYTNRNDYKDTPEALKTTTDDYRKNLVRQNLAKLVSKYKSGNYNLLKPFYFREKYGLNYDEEITISNFSKILPLYNVNGFSFTKNGTTKNITKLKFFRINDTNLENILLQINYDLNGYYFFKGGFNGGSNEYRLGYNVEF